MEFMKKGPIPGGTSPHRRDYTSIAGANSIATSNYIFILMLKKFKSKFRFLRTEVCIHGKVNLAMDVRTKGA